MVIQITYLNRREHKLFSTRYSALVKVRVLLTNRIVKGFVDTRDCWCLDIIAHAVRMVSWEGEEWIRVGPCWEGHGVGRTSKSLHPWLRLPERSHLVSLRRGWFSQNIVDTERCRWMRDAA